MGSRHQRPRKRRRHADIVAEPILVPILYPATESEYMRLRCPHREGVSAQSRDIPADPSLLLKPKWRVLSVTRPRPLKGNNSHSLGRKRVMITARETCIYEKGLVMMNGQLNPVRLSNFLNRRIALDDRRTSSHQGHYGLLKGAFSTMLLMNRKSFSGNTSPCHPRYQLLETTDLTSKRGFHLLLTPLQRMKIFLSKCRCLWIHGHGEKSHPKAIMWTTLAVSGLHCKQKVRKGDEGQKEIKGTRKARLRQKGGQDLTTVEYPTMSSSVKYRETPENLRHQP
ncbi:hypothetical protein I7I51_05042 [Histoplasma capsulatum]|uniref:Uncharacterized protein n=1 Tax=Ajellomyces capsulatus TaxID=5037 RepID=A0A8A1M3Q5_AJECA|nr:hypothetical protein I7I51_05042 [Histoplasma capsulatum]